MNKMIPWWRCRVLPMVEMWDGWNSLSVNLHNKHVFPTPESPRSRSRKSTSYCLAIVLGSVQLKKSPSQLTQRWMTDPSPPAFHVCSNGQHGALAMLLFVQWRWICRWVTKQGCSSFPGSLQLPVGAVDHCKARLNEKRPFPVVLSNIKAFSSLIENMIYVLQRWLRVLLANVVIARLPFFSRYYYHYNIKPVNCIWRF